MHDYQREFLEFAIATGVLRLGDFTLKSGRKSPYFFNAGAFSTGGGLARLGGFYAAALMRSGLAVDMLFGPAYKGIPLAACTAIALAEHHGQDLPFAFNRKEAKDHGEGGSIVGSPLAGRVLIVDDVITAGTSVRESVAHIQAAGAVPAGVLIALDRCERGAGEQSATAEIAATFGLATVSIVSLHDLVEHLHAHTELAEHHHALAAYRTRYGTAAPG